ncbi:MAG: M14 family zinc carboxypeptidase [candidate division KSB1 bacterium]|nr:M14 family zinc carboxypeptidase [candidate division KSB1 bacterium]
MQRLTAVACLLTSMTLIVVAPAAQQRERFRVYAPTRHDVETVLAQDVELLATDFGRSLDVFCTAETAKLLQSAGLQVQRLIGPLPDPRAQGFHTYEETKAFLLQVAAAYPSIARLDSLTSSVQGRGIWALKISDNPFEDEDEPCLLVEGCIHGNEHHSLEACLYFINYMVTRYGTDPEVTSWVNEREVWVVPLVNPDGHELNRRTNAHEVDLNRNFGYWWGFAASSYGTAPFSEPESRAIRDLAESVRPYGSIAFHTAGRLVLYPWAYIDSPPTPDDRLFALVARELVDSINAVSTLGRYSFRRSGTWYWHGGEHNDWMYSQYGILSFTIEMMDSQTAPPSEEENKAVLPALRVMLRLPDRRAVTGRVTEAVSGLPLPARLSVLELFDPDQPVWNLAEPVFGRFIRFLLPGAYTLEVQVPGYPRYQFPVLVKTGDARIEHNLVVRGGADLVVQRIVVSDGPGAGEQGDSNGQINPGEVVALVPQVYNRGGGLASALRAVLRSASPLAHIVTASLFLGDVPAGTEVLGTPGFLVRVGQQARPGEALPLELRFAAADGYPWSEFTQVRLQGFNDDMENGWDQWTHGVFPDASNTVDDWQYGLVRGEGGDPGTAYSGRFVWGTDLGEGAYDGRYANDVHNYLQMRTLNCRGWLQVYLHFYRWLTVQQGDRAYITVNDRVVWDNLSHAFSEASWSYQVVDISAAAADRDSVVVRFCLRTNSSGTAGGWTIDDVMVSDRAQVGVAPTTAPPMSHLLAQNFPNPFNSATTFVFTLPERMHVSLIVYNLDGQELKRLVDGVLPAGPHRLSWNSEDEQGRKVATGIYLASLCSRLGAQTLKLVCVR